MLRKILVLAALAIPFAGTAMADDKADAKAKCLAVGEGQTASMPADQKAKMIGLYATVCTCITDKVEALGDDGAKVLRILAKQTPEQAAESADRVKDKANTVAILEAEYGMSESDAGAMYEKISPQVSQISQTCAADAMKSVTPPQ